MVVFKQRLVYDDGVVDDADEPEQSEIPIFFKCTAMKQK